MIIKSLKRPATPKKLIIIGGVILLLAAIPLTYVYAFNGSLFGWQKSTTLDTNKDKNSVDKSGSTDAPPAPTTIPGSDKKNVQITITAANQNESTLQIRTLVSAVENTGLCTLTLTSTGKTTVIKKANSQALASTSTCQGFDVPVSELSTGTWHAIIEYSSTALTGSATQDIVIK